MYLCSKFIVEMELYFENKKHKVLNRKVKGRLKKCSLLEKNGQMYNYILNTLINANGFPLFPMRQRPILITTGLN
jgi:hypothetical protein